MADLFELTTPHLIEKKLKFKVEKKEMTPIIKKNMEIDRVFDYYNYKKQRNWQHILEKIAFEPEDPDYYADKKVKPGFSFWAALTEARNIEKLQVNIPETLINIDTNIFMLQTDENGFIKRTVDALAQDFESEIYLKNKRFCEQYQDKEYVQSLNYENNFDMPMIISRGPSSSDWLLTKQVHSVRAQKERRNTGNEMSKMDQNYILSRALKASIYRLVYHTRNYQHLKANYAYKIINYIDIFKQDDKVNILNKSTLNTEKQFSFEIFKKVGLNLKEFEVYAERVCTFLERAFQVRITQVVLDFIQDLEGKIYLINMKKIETEQFEEIKLKEKKTLDELTCSVYCKLCGLIFKKDDASKVLTFKLLWELMQHLKKRGRTLKSNIVISNSSTQPARVCNLCYMLVVGEHQLIEIEQQFARAQNIPINNDVVRIQRDSKPSNRPALLDKNLIQWRLLISINEIQGINKDLDYSNLYFQFKLFNYKTSFKIKVSHHYPPKELNQPLDLLDFRSNSKVQFNLDQQNSEVNSLSVKPVIRGNVCTVNQIRVHYFFSENHDLMQFINETEIKMRITKGEDWNDFIAEGSSKTIQHFKNKKTEADGGQRHSSQVLCFFEDASYCTLKMNAGLVCDGFYNTEHMNLYHFNNIYFPDEDYYNSNQFPAEWIEMFNPTNLITDDSTLKQDFIEANNVDFEKYTPNCSRGDLNKMIDFDSQKNNRFKHVKSTLSRAQSAVGLQPKLVSIKTSEKFQSEISNLDRINSFNPMKGTVNALVSSNVQSQKNLLNGQKQVRPFTANLGNNPYLNKAQSQRQLSSKPFQQKIFSANKNVQTSHLQRLIMEESKNEFNMIDEEEQDVLNKYELNQRPVKIKLDKIDKKVQDIQKIKRQTLDPIQPTVSFAVNRKDSDEEQDIKINPMDFKMFLQQNRNKINNNLIQ